MINKQQTMIPIEISSLLERTREMFDAGFRLVQIGCTKLANNELTYAFDKDLELTYFKIIAAPDGPELPSISSIYWSAFLYENEIHDLYGVNFSNIAIDFHGNFYRTSQDKAFAFCDRVANAKPATTKPEATTQTSSSSTGSDK